MEWNCLVGSYILQSRDRTALLRDMNLRDVSTLVIVETMEVDAVCLEKELKVKGEPREQTRGSNFYDLNKTSCLCAGCLFDLEEITGSL